MDENTTTSIVAHEEAPKEAAAKTLSIQNAIIINALIVGVAIVLGAFIVHGSFSAKNSGDVLGDNSGAQAPSIPVDIKNVKTAGDPYIGNQNAKVTIAYWSDYQCPFCKKFETDVFSAILKTYVANGTVKVVFKDFSFLGPDSDTAALYARAVWALYPSQYFAWREAMFNSQDTENSGFGDEASVTKLTSTIAGIDATTVQQAVAKNKDAYQKAMDADRAEAVNFGVKGTPSFITGKELVPGLPTYDALAAALDAQLK